MVNKALSTEIKKIREYVKRKDTGNRYIAAWREQDWYNGKKDAFTIILRTSGCYWSLIQDVLCAGISMIQIKVKLIMNLL